MKTGLANYLTYCRLAAVPFLILSFFLHMYGLALLLFVLASATDLVDGTIARMLNQRSQWGAFFDPLADKLLMVSTFGFLAIKGTVAVGFFILIVLRDIMIMGGLAYLKYRRIEVEYKSILSSKLTTLMLMATGALGLSTVVFPQASVGVYPLIDFLYGAVVVTVMLIIISGLQYAVKGIDILMSYQHRRPGHSS